MAESSPKEFTLAEVAEHNTANDCWLAINGKVYDVTTFLQDHPGGEEIIIENGGARRANWLQSREGVSAGREATDDFEDIGHSQSARDLLPQSEVGVCPVRTH